MKNFSLAILFISLFLGNEQNIRTNTILFCIKPNYDNLNIVYRNNNFDTNYEELNSNKGVITPAECSGELMIRRLINAGIKFDHQITNLT